MVDTVLPIANGFYTSNSLPVSAQNCVNWYPHINEAPALNQEILIGTPGLGEEILSDPSLLSAIRGAHRMGGHVYYVGGTTLLAMAPDRTISGYGTIAGSGRVSMADNGVQLIIVNTSGMGYIFNWVTDTLTAISDVDFDANGNPKHVTFVDGYFVCTTDERGKFICSALNNGLAWNALDFGNAESSPDASMVPIVVKNQLMIVGQKTCEQFANVPNGAAFPFQRTGLFLAKGTSAPFSVVSTGDTFLFVGGGANESPAVWAMEGNGLVKKSTSAIDKLLQDVSQDDFEDIFAWSYSQDGHYFVGFTLPTTTIVYDLATDRWHERSSRLLVDDEYVDGPYRVSSFVEFGNDIVATDTQDGRVGFLSADTYTEYGNEIIRTFTTQPFQNNMQPFFVPKLELTVESGVGLIPTVCCFTYSDTATPQTYDFDSVDFETAQDVTDYFSTEYNADIISLADDSNISTSHPHADITAESMGGTTHFYKFTVCDEGAECFVQVHDEVLFEPFFYVYDSDYTVVAASSGGYERVLLDAGTYYVGLFDYFNDPVPDGATYTMYISVSCFEQAANAIDPSMRLKISRDGGKTWGQERSRSMGRMGEYDSRPVWRRNGRCARFDVYRFTMSDPVKAVAIQLVAQLEGADETAA